MNRRKFIKLLGVAVLGGSFQPAIAAFGPIKNPYLDLYNLTPEFHRVGPIVEGGESLMGGRYLSFRSKCTAKYSWAVPTPEAISEITHFADSIVDFGAGSGYWAGLLSDYGARVRCIDNWSDGKPPGLYHAVATGSFELLSMNSNKALMMVWPPDRQPMALKAVKAWGGKKLIYVGEPATNGMARGTADNYFMRELSNNWTLVKTINIPQWYNRNDAVMLYERS